MTKSFEEKIYTKLSLIGKATASPKRLEILDLLNQSPRTVESLSKQTNMSVANTSQHLKVLANTNLVESEKNGLYVIYRLAGKEVGNFFLSIRNLAKLRIAEIDKITDEYLKNQPIYKMKNAKLLIKQLEKDELVMLDVRPHHEYAASHIPGAISIPLDQLVERVNELSKDQDIIIYCRGPFCILSVKAVDLLIKNGYRAKRLDQGMPEWKAEGLPIEISQQSHPINKSAN